jgi:hypothetical protein
MPEQEPQDTTKAFEEAADARGQRYYVLCEDHIKGYYELEVVDLYQEPSVAEEEEIIAAPTLIKKTPGPRRKLVGDLSDAERVLIGLGIHHTETLRRRVYDEE